MPSQLGYWKIRGLAEPIRLMLIYAGEDFEDRFFQVGPAPENSRHEWLDVKYKLDLSFPNLPYYKDDDVNITQSNAIFRHLGRKHNLDGDTVKEKADCDVALEAVMDLRNGFIQLCYRYTAEEYKEKRDSYVEQAKSQIATFKTVLGDKPFLIGEKPLTCDFHLCEMLDHHRIFEPTILDDFPKLKEYCARFEALPKIKEYLESGKRKALPVNNPIANFIGNP